MSFQPESENYAAWRLVNGCYLALGTNASTPLTQGYRGYQDVPVTWSRVDGHNEGVAYLYAENGLLTNAATFKWPEADDESGQSQDGYGTITHFFILDSSRNIRYCKAFPESVSIPQDWRPRFQAGQLQLQMAIQEVST